METTNRQPWTPPRVTKIEASTEILDKMCSSGNPRASLLAMQNNTNTSDDDLAMFFIKLYAPLLCDLITPLVGFIQRKGEQIYIVFEELSQPVFQSVDRI